MTPVPDFRVPRPGERCAKCGRELHQAAYRVPSTSTAINPWICGWCLPPTTEHQENQP